MAVFSLSRISLTDNLRRLLWEVRAQKSLGQGLCLPAAIEECLSQDGNTWLTHILEEAMEGYTPGY